MLAEAVSKDGVGCCISARDWRRVLAGEGACGSLVSSVSILRDAASQLLRMSKFLFFDTVLSVTHPTHPEEQGEALRLEGRRWGAVFPRGIGGGCQPSDYSR